MRTSEHAVIGQVDLAVRETDLPALEQHAGVGRRALAAGHHGTHGHGHVAGGLREVLERAALEGDRHRGHEVTERVARQRQFGEDEQGDALLAGPLDPADMEVQVGLEIPERGVDLGNGDTQDSTLPGWVSLRGTGG
jgi:hypothetical protein